ncbi:Uncharacterised protein [Mycobacteroides abscessus subsp. massiliense]|nr:Uncharacterised protein [Mycobacteroides abscessus subsp. abscessus]SKM75725.1 Uncharacterised protein [Mycobacteroides abscessus subsp. massiliense]SKM77099.1 Uncharacterised protein [Mycobacteroides abscessus subsp. massiliense]SKM87571.1 Uncharacterised protein [Mycobacteroides abscessus subsp. massiliense]SKN87603.1 Uncharacterised protein [Mycobacteroides abscessus subsp. massiliense]
MTETEAPLTPGERLLIVALYASLTVPQNRPSLGRLASERACYADHDIRGPETLSRKIIPATRASEGFRTC